MGNYQSDWTGEEIDLGISIAYIGPLIAGQVESGDYVPFYDATDGGVKKAPVDGPGGVAVLDTNGKLAAQEAAAYVVAVNSSKTLAASDAGTCQVVNSASAVTITIAAGVFPVGTEIEVLRQGSGDVQFVAGTGITLLCKEVVWAIANQYSSACLKQVASNTWVLQGDIG